jgi:hypothetical protein
MTIAPARRSTRQMLDPPALSQPRGRATDEHVAGGGLGGAHAAERERLGEQRQNRADATVFDGRNVDTTCDRLAWLFVHLVFLTGFKNRIAALANWTIAFIGRGRRQRTITLQQLFARTQQPPFQQPLPFETSPTATSTNGSGVPSEPTTQTSERNN